MPEALFLLLPVAALMVVVLGGLAVMRVQKVQVHGIPPADTSPKGFQQSTGETREAYVRRHWQRPGVVANGVTLVDLYDRISELERRLAEAEEKLKGLSPSA